MVNAVCLAIPCLNEEKALRSNLPRLVKHLRTLRATRWEVVVVDNGSTDGTQAVVRELQAQYSGVSLLVQAKRGRGNAIQMAWRASQAGVLAYMDADLAVDIAHITDLVEPLLDGRADVVYGNRFDARSTVERSRLREWLSRGYRLFARAMLGPEIQDFQCGFKAIRAACRDDLLGEIKDGHWFFDTELLVRATTRGLRVRGIPIRWRDRDETRVCLTATSLSNVSRLVKLRRELARQRHPALAGGTHRRVPSPAIASQSRAQQSDAQSGPGFTLIELLVTLAIIALLAAWLLPSLLEAKRKGGRIQCLNHLRQLQLAYLAYTDDHTQRLPSNGCRPDAEGHWRSTARAWCGPSAAPIDADATAIKAGVLFPYVGNEQLYRCPTDTSRIAPTATGQTPLRTRSFALNGALRGYSNEWYRMVTRLSEVAVPASVLAFLDESAATIDDGHFMIHLPPSTGAPNLPAIRHGSRTPVSFLDGHCEAMALGKDARVLQRYTVQREASAP